MVEALGADGTHESLRVRVCTRRAHRGADGLDADGGEHLDEAGGELGVPVADEEPEASTGLFEIGGEVAGDRVTHGSLGLVMAPRTWTTRRSSSITNNT